MLPSYLFLCVTHLQRSLSHFTCDTLIEVPILFQGHSYIIPLFQRHVICDLILENLTYRAKIEIRVIGISE